MTIRTRVLGGLSLVIAVSILGAALILYIQGQDATLAGEALRTGRVLQVHADLSRTLTDLKVERRMAVLTLTSTSATRTGVLEQNAAQLFADLGTLVVNPQQRQLLAELQARYQGWRARPGPTITEMSQAAVERVFHETDAAFAPLAVTLEEFVAHQRVLSETAQNESGIFRRLAQFGFFAIAVVIVLTSAALLAVFRSSVLKPLATLTAAAASITRGEVTRIAPTSANDEIGLLTNALARMLASNNEREREVRSKHDELRVTLETVPAAFLLVDREGQLRLQNKAATALLGPPPTSANAMQHYRSQFTLAARDGTSIPPERWPLARALRGETVVGDDITFEGRAGFVEMLATAAPIRNDAGEIDGAVVALQDVSALRAADRLKDEFVSVVSHELRTPLTSIRGSLQLVLDDPSCVAGVGERQLLNVALSNCERLMRIINDILDISKIEAGHMTLVEAPVQVSELVQLARQDVDPLAQAARVRLVTVLPEQSPIVHVDRDRMVQALVNIVSNAVKFAPPDSTVTIEVSGDGREVAIAVADQGSGIAAADLQRVFDKFRQVDSSASRRKGGTGLGLAITKALVEQHGGRIEATSVVGQGARFTVVLPLAADGSVERRAHA